MGVTPSKEKDNQRGTKTSASASSSFVKENKPRASMQRPTTRNLQRATVNGTEQNHQQQKRTNSSVQSSVIATRRRLTKSADHAPRTVSTRRSAGEELVMLGDKNKPLSQRDSQSSPQRGPKSGHMEKANSRAKVENAGVNRIEDTEDSSSSSSDLDGIVETTTIVGDIGGQSYYHNQASRRQLSSPRTPDRRENDPERNKANKTTASAASPAMSASRASHRNVTPKSQQTSAVQSPRKIFTPQSHLDDEDSDQDPETLFKGLTFYIPPGPTRATWREKIEDHGGVVVRFPSEALNRAEVIYLFDPSQTTVDHLGKLVRETRPTFSTDWVEESINSNKHVDLYSYSVHTICSELPKRAGKKKRSSYSKEEDTLLIDLVKAFENTNDYTLGGLRLWKRIEQEFRQRGYRRTYHSLKDHFRRHIARVSSLSAPGVTDNLEVPEDAHSSDSSDSESTTSRKRAKPTSPGNVGNAARPTRSLSPAKKSARTEAQQQSRSSASATSVQEKSSKQNSSSNIKNEIDAIAYNYNLTIPVVIAYLMECKGDLNLLKQRLNQS